MRKNIFHFKSFRLMPSSVIIFIIFAFYKSFYFTIIKYRYIWEQFTTQNMKIKSK